MDVCIMLSQMHIESNAILHPAQTREAPLEIPEDVVFGEHEGIGRPVHTESAASVIKCGRGSVEGANIPFDRLHGVVAQETGHPLTVGLVVLAEQKEDAQRMNHALAHGVDYITEYNMLVRKHKAACLRSGNAHGFLRSRWPACLDVQMKPFACILSGLEAAR